MGNLMRPQVKQPEKEKKELNGKVLVLTKRLDHIERAYRKEERPLLAKTTRSSRRTTARCSAQKARLGAQRQTPVQDVETKKRLSRMPNDYE